jgi:L-amino acid N-acyltransferase YncA
MHAVLRPATLTDIPAIAAIYRTAVLTGTATFELEPPDDHEMARRLIALNEGGFPYFVAHVEGTLAGYAYASTFRPRPAYRWSVENSVYVADSCQRQGIGRALLAHLIDACAARGFRQMIAVIGDSSRQQGSIALHEALGFRHAGTMEAVGFKHGRWLDSLFMQRALGDGGNGAPD